MLLIEFRGVMLAGAGCILAIVFAAAAISWVKMQEAGLSSALSVIYCCVVALLVRAMLRVERRLKIERGTIVHGDMSVEQSGGGKLNLASVELPSGAPAAGSASPQSRGECERTRLASTEQPRSDVL